MEDGTIHFEICMDKEGGYYIKSQDGLDLTTAVRYMTAYLAFGALPGQPDQSRYLPLKRV